MTGYLESVKYDRHDGHQYVTLAIDEDMTDLYDSIKGVKLDITLAKHREKRSLDANGYMWLLCGRIAEHIQNDDAKATKESVYREAIREIGVYRDFPDMAPGNAKALCTAWQSLGTGWVTEQVDYSQDGERVTIRCYYGSSRYNTRQMSLLIDNLIQDCEALGIPHETPDEIENIKSLWATAPKGERNGQNGSHNEGTA